MSVEVGRVGIRPITVSTSPHTTAAVNSPLRMYVYRFIALTSQPF